MEEWFRDAEYSAVITSRRDASTCASCTLCFHSTVNKNKEKKLASQQNFSSLFGSLFVLLCMLIVEDADSRCLLIVIVTHASSWNVVKWDSTSLRQFIDSFDLISIHSRDGCANFGIFCFGSFIFRIDFDFLSQTGDKLLRITISLSLYSFRVIE